MTDTHTQTPRQTDASDLIICPMLCYSNGTDKYDIIRRTKHTEGINKRRRDGMQVCGGIQRQATNRTV